MRYTTLFGKTTKELPKNEVSLNAQLLIKAGYIHKESAGVYTFLPLGLKVLKKICNILREEINAIGGQELLLTTLQEKDLWEKTGRWDDKKVDVWFKTKLQNGSEIGLALTHEEPLTRIAQKYIHSYRDLPMYPYQIQTKFRNEIRARSGIIRGREFPMKDLYSFNSSQQELDDFYEKCKIAYLNFFNRIGLGDLTYVTFASGGIFSKYSHEFQTICESGEDTIYICEEKKIAINQEVLTDEVLKDLNLKREELVEKKSIETGNIFKLGTKFSQALDLKFVDQNGQPQYVIMGCYGIGPGRSMGTIVEVHSDNHGIVWPDSIAPYQIHLAGLNLNNPKVKTQVEQTYQQLLKANIEVLYDDREDVSAGEKFADADLIGIPWRAVVSEKTSGQIEIKRRNQKLASHTTLDEFLTILKK